MITYLWIQLNGYTSTAITRTWNTGNAENVRRWQRKRLQWVAWVMCIEDVDNGVCLSISMARCTQPNTT